MSHSKDFAEMEEGNNYRRTHPVNANHAHTILLLPN